MPPVISLIGRPDSGKTTLIEKLIPALSRRGMRVGTIKHHVHDSFEMDVPGKDTWRHRQAGAATVLLSSPTGIGMISVTPCDPPIEELVRRYFFNVDLVITEGYKKSAFPKIEIFRSARHKEPLPGRDHTWIAMVADVERPVADIPWFGMDDTGPLADFIVKKILAETPKKKTSLVVNGREVPLNPFVDNFIRQSVLGMVKALKGCGSPGDVSLFIRNDD